MASNLGNKVMRGPLYHTLSPSAKSIGLCEPYQWLVLQQPFQSMRPPTEIVAATLQRCRLGHCIKGRCQPFRYAIVPGTPENTYP